MSSKTPITRRNALKLLAATSGALLGSAMLPAKWLKPVVETGVLPVHAQASVALSIAGLEAAQEYRFDGTGHHFIVNFAYTDTLGEVDGTWTLNASWTVTGTMACDGMALSALGATVSGGGSSGIINFDWYNNTCIFGQPAHTDIANISISKGARVSNVLTAPVTEFEVGTGDGVENVEPAHQK
jgi:hypothetical protein